MATNESLTSLVRRRELSRTTSRHVTRNKSLLDRLWLESELDGHTGCVNCLEWNQSGTLLASGSDDRTVKLWDAHRGLKLVDLKSGHREIIFSVKFLPQSSDRLVASAGTDGQVRLHDVNVSETVEVWDCHASRVKRLTVAHDRPQMLWSGSEDGTVAQLDLRTSHRKCDAGAECPNTLINARVAVKCVAINPVRTHLLAVGFMDEVVRLFDLRFVSDTNVVRYFSPGAVFNSSASRRVPVSVTYVSWSADGRKLLANYSGDQVYMFDVDDDGRTVECKDRAFSPPQLPAALRGHPSVTAGQLTPEELTAVRELDERLEALDAKMLSTSVGACWAQARRMPHVPEMHDRLRRQLTKRSWRGDLYAALRAARMQAALQPGSATAAVQMLDAYTRLRWWNLAKACVVDLRRRFPDIDRHPEYTRIVEGLRNSKSHDSGDGRTQDVPLGSVGDSEAYFCGHFNRLTDIKEANFLDKDCRYIVAGSDDRMMYIWEVESTRLLYAMLADGEVVNCCQPHPDTFLLATSGIDNTIRLWCPQNLDTAPMEKDDRVTGAKLEARALHNHNCHNAHAADQYHMFAFGPIIFQALEMMH